MEKKLYVSPDAEFIGFASEDIMQASETGNLYGKDYEDGWDANWGE